MGVAKVFVEIAEDGRPFRVIKDHAQVWKLPPEKVAQWPKSEAVKAVRQQVVDRADGECEFCGARVVAAKGEMHEVVFRSQGGEVSVDNSVFICRACHRRSHGVKV